MKPQLLVWSPKEWSDHLSFPSVNWNQNWTFLWFYVYHQYEIYYEDLDNYQEALLLMGENAKERKLIQKGIDLVWSTWLKEKA